jgi:hypothetical protein
VTGAGEAVGPDVVVYAASLSKQITAACAALLVRAGLNADEHGSGWPGLRALLARVPDLDVSLMILALADDTERRVDLS